MSCVRRACDDAEAQRPSHVGRATCAKARGPRITQRGEERMNQRTHVGGAHRVAPMQREAQPFSRMTLE